MNSEVKKETRGRPRIDDKKVVVQILPRQSEIDLLGGRNAVRQICEDHISSLVTIKKLTHGENNT